MKRIAIALFIVQSAACSRAPVNGILPRQSDAHSQASTPEALIHQTFAHGVPYEQARALGPDASKTLIAMLADPEQEPFLANIVVALGILGDPSSVDPLIGVVQRGRGRLTREQYAARSGAIMALGYLVNASDDARAMQYLQEGATVETWSARKIDWDSPFAESAADRNRDLAQVAILGLALTGKRSASDTLRRISARRGDGADLDARLSQLATDALREHEIIARDGLAAYYRRNVGVQPAR